MVSVPVYHSSLHYSIGRAAQHVNVRASFTRAHSQPASSGISGTTAVNPSKASLRFVWWRQRPPAEWQQALAPGDSVLPSPTHGLGLACVRRPQRSSSHCIRLLASPGILSCGVGKALQLETVLVGAFSKPSRCTPTLLIWTLFGLGYGVKTRLLACELALLFSLGKQRFDRTPKS